MGEAETTESKPAWLGRADSRPARFFAAREALARDLQEARLVAGLTTHELAARMEISQSKVSKIENARVGISVGDVAAWGHSVGLGEDAIAQLTARATSALTEALGARDLGSRGLAERQRQVASLELAATTILNFEPSVIPGLLQTAAYAQRIFSRGPASPAEVAAAVAARLERQTILYEPEREFRFLIPADLLEDLPEPNSLALAQLDRLRSLLTLPNVHIGLVRRPGRTLTWHSHSFAVYEGLQEGIGQVSVEILTAHINISDRSDVSRYRQAFETLCNSADFGPAVLRAVESAMAVYKQEDIGVR